MSLQFLFSAFDACADWVIGLNSALAPYSDWYFSRLHELLPDPFFNTQAFVLFFALVFALYWLIPRRWQMTRIWLLVAASFHFYAAWSKDLAFLVLTTTLADYLFGRLMDSTERKRIRLGVVFASITMNLGVLCYFKYRGFFLNELHESLVRLGYDPGYGKLDVARILVPFGISFYTFEAISYAVDVYRRKIAAERSLPRFLLFILFFPHLVSGPIVRAGDFLHQSRRPKRWNWIRVQIGMQLLLMGVFKKMAIADRMALFCDQVFRNPADYSSEACWLAVLAFAIRIYCDFSGYSDMAVGLAHLFGYKLTNNFNMPYLAENVTEFWRRWHISLSNWLRDYIFIPLSGGRKSSQLRMSASLVLTLTVGGIWHGAGWSYILLFGVCFGLMQTIHRQFKSYCSSRPRLDAVLQTKLGTCFRVLLTFCCIYMVWPLFQPDLGKALELYSRMFSFGAGKSIGVSEGIFWGIVGFVAFCHLLVKSGLWERINSRLPAPILGIGCAGSLCVALLLAPPTGPSFVYFQF